MIGHNSRTECARESVKTSSDSEDSNAFLRYAARTLFGENPFLTLQKIRGFYWKSHGAKTKNVGNNVSV